MVEASEGDVYPEQSPSDASVDSKQSPSDVPINLKPVHHVPVAEVLARLETDLENGLTDAQVEKRRLDFGRNVLPPPKGNSIVRELVRSFSDLFSLILQVAACLCFVAYALDPKDIANFYLGVFLYGVVVVTCLFSFAQKYKADRTLREFANFLPPSATVLRNGGHIQIVPAAELVRGDIVKLKLGDKVPADIRITKASAFAVDQSPLTGESIPVKCSVAPTTCKKHESTNMAFFGTLAVDGTAEGIVTSIGVQTEFGKIVELTVDSGDDRIKTTLQEDMHHFVIVTALFSLGIGIVFFCAGIVNKTRLIHNLVYSIGMFVSNIPEGLIATVTVALTASARRMAARKVLVKKLDAIESLGSSTVICSDKTGTLTKNSMHVSSIYYGSNLEVVDKQWTPPAEQDKNIAGWKSLKFCAATCSTAVFDDNDRKQFPDKPIDARIVCGDASEAGILRFMEAAFQHEGGAYQGAEDMRKKCNQIASIPFNSSQKFMVTINRQSESDKCVTVVMKGAPERVLEKCIEMECEDGARIELTDSRRDTISGQVTKLASSGERVLAYAKLELSSSQTELLEAKSVDGSIPREHIPQQDLVFVGLISLKDPPRDGVSEAVSKVRNAGLRVIMVTGDHPGTALAIAKQVDIVTMPLEELKITGTGGDEDSLKKRKRLNTKLARKQKSVVITGSQFSSLAPDDWDRLLSYEEIVFARTSPEQKLLIVKELQMQSEVVAVTGDGVNDAPALKQAEIGISMGLSGTEVSKEASDIVLLDDNFASIVNGVEEGRLIFDNLKKSIAYSLTSNVPQLVPFLSFVLFHIPVPLTTILVLSIDLGTDIFPAITLAYEKAESDLMDRPPRNVKTEKLLNRQLLNYAMLQLGILQTIGGFVSYFFAMNESGFTPMSIVGIDRLGRFSGAHAVDQRWLYQIRGASPEAPKVGWFSDDNPTFVVYFSESIQGFEKQTVQDFKELTQSPTAAIPTNNQFNNMLKAVGRATRTAPCQSYSCEIGGVLVRNNRTCFDTKRNKGPVQLDGKLDKTNVVNEKNGACFALWTPRDTLDILRYAQTAYFAAIVVAQAFTIFACKTRILSLFSRNTANLPLIMSVVVEFIIAFFIIYLPSLRAGFQVRPLRIENWLPGLVPGKFILGYDECRKWLIRRDLHPVPTLNENGDIVRRNTHLDRFARWMRIHTLW